MGFYGNITNTSHTHFLFDKIFANRTAMDTAAALGTDGIFAGRFVLVKYDPEDKTFEGDIPLGYLSNGHIYVDFALTKPYLYTTFTRVNNPNIANWESYYYSIDLKNFYKLPSEEYFNANEDNYYIANTEGDNLVGKDLLVRVRDAETGTPTLMYYKCLEGTVGAAANFSVVTFDDDTSDYLVNFNIDKVNYGNDFDPRGYDATVWLKVYSEGNGAFILIAYLNALVPDFELTANAPSVEPAAPYIDSVSGGAKYKVHVPSMWGFKIKEAESQLDENLNTTYPFSDLTIVLSYNVYENNEVINTVNREINAEIYFNKNGTVKITRNYDNETQNEILITPTGESGKIYYNDNGLQVTLDTYELAIHLPVIGNLISDFYDIFYGEERNLDIAWYLGNDNLKNTGNILLNGKTRDLNTVAGLINTFLDRLGQNIVRLNSYPNTAQINNLDEKYIYSYLTTENDEIVVNYYRKGEDYLYSPVLEFELIDNITSSNYISNTYYTYDENTNTYTLASGDYDSTKDYYVKNINFTNIGSLSEDLYEANTYYILENNEYEIADRTYNYYNGQDFYKKNITSIKYHEVNLTKYVEGTYYYLDLDNNYILDLNEAVPTYISLPYYLITSVNGPLNFEYRYIPSAYFIASEKGYDIVDEETPNVTETYYEINPSTIISGRVMYLPNKYYYYPNNSSIPRLDTSENWTNGRTYYYIPVSSNIVTVYDEDTDSIVVGYELDIEHRQRIELADNLIDTENVYIMRNNNYEKVKYLTEDDLTVSREYYSLTVTEVESFFLPNKYYTHVTSGSQLGYILATEYGNSQTDYYEIPINNILNIEYPFYEGGKYYYFNGNIYLIDTGVRMTDNRTYYTSSLLYVYNDTSGRWPYGYEWKELALFVPASVTLATREKVSTLYLLEGIDNGESSINGSILKINNLISSLNIDDREVTTVLGALNCLTDALYSISNNLIPGRILYINDFGLIAVSSLKLSDLENLVNNS